MELNLYPLFKEKICAADYELGGMDYISTENLTLLYIAMLV
ncbi:MAG: hypothetical protein QNJ46_28025 [Leptolyngbyaceae cyanobacterium MO_188.B28]|nr:hypothetical protein [Leptolyngbyaceae cyanobacterium MO_188.B28]